jgi:hypothetical protein
MLTLGQQCLLTMARSNTKFDNEDPVILDQIFQVDMTKNNNKIYIKKLKEKNETIKQSIKYSFRDIKIHNNKVYRIICDTIAYQLFDYFEPKTTTDVKWAEYFHHMYDLLVTDWCEDHANNLMLLHGMIMNHDTLNKPEVPMPNRISHIFRLFEDLKACQKSIVTELNDRMNKSLDTVTNHYLHIFRRKQVMKRLFRENELLVEILQWSTR